MNNFLGYRCSICNHEYQPSEITYTCPHDGGNLDVCLDIEAINRTTTIQDIFESRDYSLWRYLPLLPVTHPGTMDTPIQTVGWTPVYSPPKLALKLELKHLYIKDESPNPTASFKDRASAVVVVRAREINAEVVVTASTGNAGAALAGMAAASDQQAVILAPYNAPPAKIAQLLVYGAKVILIDGCYDDAFDLSLQASQEFGWYCRNTGINPFTAEGKKTAAFEIWEWDLRNHGWLSTGAQKLSIFVSVGDGNIISGIHKGFKDLKSLGWINYMPRIFGVQAEGSSAVANTFFDGTEIITPVSANTLADSISVNLPRDGVRAVRAARQTEGSYVKVSDADILDAIAALGKVGIFAEPAGAASYTGCVKALRMGFINNDDPVLVINTGSGLKDIQAVRRSMPEAPIIEPSLDALRRMIK